MRFRKTHGPYKHNLKFKINNNEQKKRVFVFHHKDIWFQEGDRGGKQIQTTFGPQLPRMNTQISK